MFRFGPLGSDFDSVGLLFQVALPCALFSQGPSQLTLKGGTNAEMAPQVEYTLNVFKNVLNKFGADFDCKIVRRGFFPAGKGILHIKVNPVTQLKPITMLEFGQVTKVQGEAFVAGVVPFRVAEEMAVAAANTLRNHLPNIPINIKPHKLHRDDAFGNGSGINLYAVTSTECYLGGSCLGKKGVNNEEIGRKAAEELLESINRKVCVDQRLQDQIIIFMALANGKSRVKAGPITLHTQTAIYIAQAFAPVKFNIEPLNNETNIIECEGIGYRYNL